MAQTVRNLPAVQETWVQNLAHYIKNKQKKSETIKAREKINETDFTHTHTQNINETKSQLSEKTNKVDFYQI